MGLDFSVGLEGWSGFEPATAAEVWNWREVSIVWMEGVVEKAVGQLPREDKRSIWNAATL